MNPAITPRQQEVLDFITAYVDDMGYSPSVSDIANAFGWKSENSASDHLKRLEKKGYIKIARGVARGITILGKDGPSAEEMMSALRVISTWASHDHEKGVRQALDPKHVLDLCNKALHREAA